MIQAGVHAGDGQGIKKAARQLAVRTQFSLAVTW
jgi:hypothetical protein